MDNSEEMSPSLSAKLLLASENGAESISIHSYEWGKLTMFPEALGELGSVKTLTISRPTLESISAIVGMKQLTGLTIQNGKLKDLSLLSELPNLRTLNIDRSKLANIASLSGLKKLTKFSWNGGHLESVQPLSGLSNLAHVSLARSSLSDLDGTETLAKLSYLDVASTSIRDLAPIANLTNLRTLNLSRTDIVDLSHLAELENLRSLGLAGCDITDLRPLSELSYLTLLHLSESSITDLSGLEKLKQLRALYINNTGITEIAPLAKLTGLSKLELKNTKLRNLSGIEDARHLRNLDVSGSSVSDISAITGLRGLETVSLRASPITDITPLKGLARLEEVDLSSTKVVDLEPLGRLWMLRSLNLNHTPVLDLRPVTALRRLKTYSKKGGLQFEGTLAAKTDPEIARISANPKERARAIALGDQLVDWELPEDDSQNENPTPVPLSKSFAFLSYSSKDSGRVGNIHSFLVDQSIPLWWDADIEAGASWRDEIAKRLSSAKAVTTFWTEDSVSSKSVIEEASEAQKLKKLIHVRLDDAVLPYGFAETQYLDLRQWDGTAEHPQMRKLLQSIQDKIAPPSPDALSARLMASSPVIMVASNGLLTPKDTPPNARPEVENAVDLEDRLIGLRQTVQTVVAKANDNESYQLPNDLRYALTSIETAINGDRLSWYAIEDANETLNGCMEAHYAKDAWNEILVQELNRISKRLLELQPLLQPIQVPIGVSGAKPPELDPLVRESDLASVVALATELKNVLASDDAHSVLDDSARDLVTREIHNLQSVEEEPTPQRKLAHSRRSVRWLAYTIGGALTAIATPVIASLLTAPEAALTLAARLRPIYEFILKLFS